MTSRHPGYDSDDLLDFLVGYGVALGSGDLEVVTDSLAYPSVVVEADRSLVVPDAGSARESLAGMLTAYREQGLVAAVPEVRAVEQVGDALLWVDVRWSYRDENASEAAADRVRYLLRRGRDTFELCVVVPVPD
ncbi:hypothetical protein ACFQHV_21065 [Promicromonospora thailandica]|uniref:Uncharacterized protein n=1 Tax=Promicromonospora thailandica TaxID=765201 RepID=A0A9X2G3Z8_9MICO|nr:hypothetical protein [Promicromonospora thailandica]MCP2266665.1 hypothetical protein [Promicromonospora thailandica]BFF17253.1 hypothetical protein GCM10025730_07740 [Promicromonospora thailandica]